MSSWRTTCRLGAAALTLALISGCASGPARSVEQTVRIETPGCTIAQCTARNDQGEWHLARAPGELRVMTSRQPLAISCQAAGHESGLSTPVQPLRELTTRSAVLGAGMGGGMSAAAVAPALATPLAPLAGAFILFGAVAGAGTGQAVDALSRSWRYAPVLSVPMRCDAPSLDEAPWGIAVRGLPVTGVPEVLRVAVGGRAAQAGVQAGDRILAVNGQPVQGMPELAAWLTGAERPLVLRVAGRTGERRVVLDDRSPP